MYIQEHLVLKIDDIKRFSSKEKLASYAGLVPRQDQSGNRDIRGHISKRGPSMLRFFLVNASHIVIKYSNKMRKKYLSIVRRVGKNRAIVAIARILLEAIYVMLSKGIAFIDEIDTLTDKKIRAMSERSRKPVESMKLDEAIKLIKKKSYG